MSRHAAGRRLGAANARHHRYDRAQHTAPGAHPRRPGRRTGSRRARVLLCLAGAAIGLTFLHVGSALAYWMTTDSSHPAAAAAATLSAPTSGAQNGTATPAAIPIRWTAPGGYAPTGYTVLRCTGSSCTSFTAIGNGSCGGTISGTSCTDTDTGLSVGKTYSYEVEATLSNWVSAASTPFQAATTATTKLVFTAQPNSNANIQATGTGSFSVSVAIEDANGATATNDNSDTVTLAVASGHNPGGGTLACTGGLTATVSSGVASFTGCAITKAGTGYQLTASSATSPSLAAPANANSFNITAGTFTQYAVGVAASATAGTPAAVTLTAQDANGNAVTTYSASNQAITWSGPQNGPNGTQPALPGGTVSFASGVSTTPLNVVFTDAGLQTLMATDGSSRTGSASTTVNGAGPANLALANCSVRGISQACTSPYSLGGTGGTLIANVQAFDQYGNAATITSALTMSVTSGNTTDYSITAGATLTVDGTATPANQTTKTFTVQKNISGNVAIQITVHVTSGQPIPDLSFTVK
jgi:hypothetical protein